MTTQNPLENVDFENCVNHLFSLHTQNIDDYNELVDELERERHNVTMLQVKNMELLTQVAELQSKVREQDESLALANKAVSLQDKVVQKGKQLEAELSRTKITLEQKQRELKELNALNPERLNKKVKEQKKKLDEQTKSIAAQRKQSNELMQANAKHRRTIDALHIQIETNKISNVYSCPGELLAIWPFQETVLAELDDGTQQREKQVGLLYLNSKGKGALMNLDPNGEVYHAKSNEIKPSADIKEFATAWLNKARGNNWVITGDMLRAISS